VYPLSNFIIERPVIAEKRPSNETAFLRIQIDTDLNKEKEQVGSKITSFGGGFE